MNDFDPNIPITLDLLPPAKDKIESISILQSENRARSAIAELKGLAHIIPNQSILINAIVLQESKDSSEVENIITTRDKLYKAMTLSSVKKYDPATKEVLHYREALFEGYERVSRQSFISVNDIIHLQKLLIKNDAGVRSTPGTKLFNNKTNEVVYTPPQDFNQINSLLNNFADYLNDKEDSLTKLAVLHYQFETIHPFYDGNSRTGRIINVLYLILKKYLDIPILYLSSYIIANKQEYYSLLNQVNRYGEWEKWILFILEGIEEISRNTIDKIWKIKNLLDKTVDEIKTIAPKIYSKELVETLFVHPYCKNEFLVKNLNIERRTASKYLHTLTELGILQIHKIGKENIFINLALMDILKS